jgi:hypothetical protein
MTSGWFLRGGHLVVEVLLHLACFAEDASGVRQRAHRFQRHPAQGGFLEGQLDRGQ